MDEESCNWCRSAILILDIGTDTVGKLFWLYIQTYCLIGYLTFWNEKIWNPAKKNYLSCIWDSFKNQLQSLDAASQSQLRAIIDPWKQDFKFDKTIPEQVLSLDIWNETIINMQASISVNVQNMLSAWSSQIINTRSCLESMYTTLKNWNKIFDMDVKRHQLILLDLVKQCHDDVLEFCKQTSTDLQNPTLQDLQSLANTLCSHVQKAPQIWTRETTIFHSEWYSHLQQLLQEWQSATNQQELQDLVKDFLNNLPRLHQTCQSRLQSLSGSWHQDLDKIITKWSPHLGQLSGSSAGDYKNHLQNLIQGLQNHPSIQEKMLKDFLSSVQSNIKQNKNVFIAPQMAIMYPIPRFQKFDITLLTALLRNFCSVCPPERGWYVNDHSDTDVWPGTDINRLRHYKNNILSHDHPAKVPSDAFNDLWDKITGILCRLASRCGQDYVTKVKQITEELRICPFNSLISRLEKVTHELRDQSNLSEILATNQVILSIVLGIFEAVRRNGLNGDDCHINSYNGPLEENKCLLNTDTSMSEQDFIDKVIQVRKYYPRLKSELSREQAVAIARFFPTKDSIQTDVVELVRKAERRRLSIDYLLKKAIQDHCLRRFLIGLQSVCPAEMSELSSTNITEKDRQRQVAGQEMGSSSKRISCRIDDRNIMFFQNHISDLDVIDAISDKLYSRFHFNVSDHSEITKYSVKDGDVRCIPILFGKIQSCNWESETELEEILQSTLPSNVYMLWSKHRNERSANQDGPGPSPSRSFIRRIYDALLSRTDTIRQTLGIHFHRAENGSIVLKFLVENRINAKSLKPELVKKILMEVISESKPELMNPVHVSVFIKSPRDGGKEIIYFYLDFDQAVDMNETKEDDHDQLGTHAIDFMAEEMDPVHMEQWIYDHPEIDADTKKEVAGTTSSVKNPRRETVKHILDIMNKVKNGYKMLETFCTENYPFVYKNVFDKTRQPAETPKPAELYVKEGGLQKLFSMWIKLDEFEVVSEFDVDSAFELDSEVSDCGLVWNRIDDDDEEMRRFWFQALMMNRSSGYRELNAVKLVGDKLNLSDDPNLIWVKLEKMTVSSIILPQSTKLGILEMTDVDPCEGKLDLSNAYRLSVLRLKNMNMPNISLSQDTQLKQLILENVNFGDGKLDASLTLCLPRLVLHNVNMSSINLSQCTKLKSLTLKNVNFGDGKLDASLTPCLSHLIIHNVNMSSINLSQCTEWKILKLKDVKLGDGKLDLLNATHLSKLSLENIAITGINLSQCTKMEILKLKDVKLGDGKLDLSNTTLLSELSLENITITGISLPQCTEPTILKLKDVKLGDGKLDLSNTTCLIELSLENITMSNINLQQCRLLNRLYLINVNLGDGKLDISGATYLGKLIIDHVTIFSINLPQSNILETLKMTNVNLGNCKLDISDATCLSELIIEHVTMSSINLPQCTALHTLKLIDVKLVGDQLKLSGVAQLFNDLSHTNRKLKCMCLVDIDLGNALLDLNNLPPDTNLDIQKVTVSSQCADLFQASLHLGGTKRGFLECTSDETGRFTCSFIKGHTIGELFLFD